MTTTPSFAEDKGYPPPDWTGQPPASTRPSDVPVFRLVRREQKIVLDDGRGSQDEYVVREMTGTVRDQFYAEMGTKFKPGPDGKMTPVSYANMKSSLIYRCLFCQEQPVRLEVVNLWPASVQDAVYALCEKVNGMGDGAEEEAKKS